MARRLDIQIHALDRFSKVFQGFNNAASRALRPVALTFRQLGTLGRAMHLPTIGRGLNAAAVGAGRFAAALGLATGPMAFLLGTGALGGVTLLAAAVAGLTASWARNTFAIGETSKTLGLSAKEFQLWRGAARLAGLDADGAQQSLAKLVETIRLVKIGDPAGNAQATLFAKLGIDIDRAQAAGKQATPVLMSISRAIQRIADPATQLALARGLGVEEMLPLLRQGPDAVQKFMDEVARLNLQGEDAVTWSVKFTESLARLGTALEGVGNRMGNFMSPAFIGAMDALTWWMTADFKTDNAGSRFTKSYGDRWNALTGGGGASAPSAMGSRKVSGVVTDESGVPVAGGMNMGNPRDQATVMDDVLRGRETTYSSDAVRQRMEATVNVLVNIPNAPPGTSVRAVSDSPNVPARISRASPAGNFP